MFDERTFIARVESSDIEELTKILLRPTKGEEKALLIHFGEERYQRMHDMALKRSVSRAVKQLKGNVVVIHGIMGGELTSYDRKGASDSLWVNVFNLMRGWIDRLRLNESGRSEVNDDYDVRATGIMKSHYGELMLSLSENWKVRAFWFDWRRDLKLAAASLQAQISGWFEDDEPVHIVAHSMGGLVARAFIRNYEPRWQSMYDTAGEGRAGGRFIMLGTPYYGSYNIPQIMTGLEPMVRKLARFDFRHNREQVLEIVRTFVGCYQMLPSPHAIRRDANLDDQTIKRIEAGEEKNSELLKSYTAFKNAEALYDTSTYTGMNLPQRHLVAAGKFHEDLDNVKIDADRMRYIAGFNRPTPSGIKNLKELGAHASYQMDMMGDGRVTHALGIPKVRDDRGEIVRIPTYYVDADHGDLPANEEVIGALDELLETGSTGKLSSSLPAATRGVSSEVAPEASADEDEAEIRRVQDLLHNLERDRSILDDKNYLLSEERKLREELTRGYLTHSADKRARSADETQKNGSDRRLTVALVYGKIEDVGDVSKMSETKTVDAIAVGHYLGGKPVAAERALDVAISRAFSRDYKDSRDDLPENELIITQYTERGTIRGELGQPFFLNDPRAARNKRVIAIAGMGLPGYFGVPELKVLARELSWALERMGKRHLASVVIGTGNGNLAIGEAISAWLSGLSQSILGVKREADQQRPKGVPAKKDQYLNRITFVEYDPLKIAALDKAIVDEQERLESENGIKIDYKPIKQTPKLIATLEKDILRRARKEWKKQKEKFEQDGASSGADRPRERVPTRMTFAYINKAYHFTAITEDASIPERIIPLDSRLVEDANDELAGEADIEKQFERGRFIEHLLIPRDLRQELYKDAPVVLMLDSTTARIHWEMMAQSAAKGAPPPVVGDASRNFKYRDSYLGTSRGLTRQFRSTFAPPPEPPPPPVRVMRVLIVADPAEDKPLSGAEAEGAEVAELFESFNTIYNLPHNRVEVMRMFGPRKATRTNVLRELMLQPYDVLHFAGHCVYRANDDPNLTGWIFHAGKKELLTANELTRIDRVPKFIFSNACESGVTPDRTEGRNVDLAPSFAEAFFARGVSNFVCTAWPVNDIAARLFALRLYSGLLGIEKAGLEDESAGVENAASYRKRDRLEAMYEAMREARCLIAASPSGALTWGAYQHYGKPGFTFFDPETLSAARPNVPARDNTAPPKQTRAAAATGNGSTKTRTTGKRPSLKKSAK